MQITPELLHQYAKNTTERIARSDYTILAVCLTGSVLTEQNPFLGGTTDIDLLVIHIGDPKKSREILRLNDDIHYDIIHHSQRAYSDRISLRIDPWIGPMLSEAVALHDPQHFIDLTQASVRSLFHRSENVLQRAHALTTLSRENWSKFEPSPDEPGPQEIIQYLDILNSTANAIALLVGEPLAERRFLIQFQNRADRINRPGLYRGILGMLGAPKVDKSLLIDWVGEWEKILGSSPTEKIHPSLHPFRHNYYKKAFEVILESDQPVNVLWPLLYTWTLSVESLPTGNPGVKIWKDALHQIGLLGVDFSERILALDAFLEQVENSIDEWGYNNPI